jgi:acyl dehydratase
MTDVSTGELTGDDVSVGDAYTLVEEVSSIDIVKYAGASGDFNPLHVDESYARQAGNPSVFAHGMLTTGLASRMLTDWFGTPNIDRFRVRFTDRVWPGDTLTVDGEVMELESIDGSVRVDVDFAVENQDEKTVLRGDATATLPAE